MQDIGMVRRDLQDLAIDRLGRLEPTGLMMLDRQSEVFGDGGHRVDCEITVLAWLRLGSRVAWPEPRYSSPAQTPPPHCGRPQPKLGAPESPQIGSSPARPRPVCAAAGTLSCLATSMLPHFGHRATSPVPRIRVSKS
jgi:hypothetical protein